MICETPSSTREIRVELLLILWDTYVATLEQVVDAAWESRHPLAEELDAHLAHARERSAEVEAESVEFECSDESEPPEYHEGVSVEEQLIAAYAYYSATDPRGPYCGREGALANMRAVLEDAACRGIDANDETILAAARDAYQAAHERRARRRRHARHGELRVAVRAQR